MPSSAKGKRLVLVGGGHAQLYVLDNLARAPLPGANVTLIARDVLTPYSGMLPGFIAGHYTADQCHIDLAPLAAAAGVRLVRDEVVGLDRRARKVICRRGEAIDYDVVCFDIGSTPDLAGVAGAAQRATPIKPISSLRQRWGAILERAGSEAGGRHFVIVGGGAAGVEVTLAMRHRLRAMASRRGGDADAYSFAIVTKGELLADHNVSGRDRFRRVLDERQVELIEHDPVASVEDDRVVTAGGRRVGYDELIWVTEAGAAKWLADTGLALDPAGFIIIDATLRSVSDPRVFAAGDVAFNRDHPRPKAGVFAVRQGPPLARNLRRVLAGEPALPFAPQREFLSLITTGDKYAIGSRGPWSAEGRWVWWIKDQIDRRWMAKFQRPPIQSF